jgi:hypothetical protein
VLKLRKEVELRKILGLSDQFWQLLQLFRAKIEKEGYLLLHAVERARGVRHREECTPWREWPHDMPFIGSLSGMVGGAVVVVERNGGYSVVCESNG